MLLARKKQFPGPAFLREPPAECPGQTDGVGDRREVAVAGIRIALVGGIQPGTERTVGQRRVLDERADAFKNLSR